MATSNHDPLLTTAQTDFASLNRVSHRIAMIDSSEKLQQVLEKLLPRLLARIGSNRQSQIDTKNNNTRLQDVYSKIHAKLVEMLSHVMKRVREDVHCQLPCPAILELLLTTTTKNIDEMETEVTPLSLQGKPHVDPFTMNLTMAFLTCGLPRVKDVAQLQDMLPGLLVLHAACYSSMQVAAWPTSASKKSQAHQVAHLLLRTMEQLVQVQEDAISKSSSKRFKPSNTNTPNTSRSTTPAASSTSLPSETTSTTASPSSIFQARQVCQEQPEVARALYTLLLDCLLYQTTAGSSSVPPPGCSQAGQDKLKGGQSARNATKFAAEMAPRLALVQFKLRLLEFISPIRQWSLLMCDDSNNASNIINHARLNTARTVSLLVTASGDGSPEVAQRAASHLKQYVESSSQTQETTAMNDSSNPTHYLGEPMALLLELLTLCVGANNAEMALSKNHIQNSSYSLGLLLSLPQNQTQLALSFQRRTISAESSFATIATFCTKVLDETPQLLFLADDDNDDTATTTNHSVHQAVAVLSVLAVQKVLSQLQTSTGLTALRGKPFVAAAQLLQSLVNRLTMLRNTTTSNGDINATPLSLVLLPHLAKALATACSVLALVSTSRSNSVTGLQYSSEGNIAVRDALYGAICTLSRSFMATEPKSLLYSLGKMTPTITSQDSISSVISIDTASLLFGCAANEEEVLRPRAVAALDALLAAYCKQRGQITLMEEESSTNSVSLQVVATTVAPGENPWIQTTTTTTPLPPVNPSTPSPSSFQGKELAQALLPLLWSASQSLSKQARVASVRWNSELIKELELEAACRLLCFQAGDPDLTVSSIAKEKLGVNTIKSKSSGDEIDSSTALPDFASFVDFIFSKSEQSLRPTYWSFSPAGKAATIQFALKCLLSDLYGGEDHAIDILVSALVETLPQAARHIELLDEAAVGLATCLSSSSRARKLICSGDLTLGLNDIKQMVFEAKSSKARRHLAAACGQIFKDSLLWSEDDKWVEAVQNAMATCVEYMKECDKRTGGQVHGAAFLGGACVQALLLFGGEVANAERCLELCSSTISFLGDGLLNPDEAIGNAYAKGISLALDQDSHKTFFLDERLHSSIASTLKKLAAALKKFGTSDHADPTRASWLAKAAGHALAASTPAMLSTTVSAELGAARLACVEALFAQLGSPAYRKDDELALTTGEALALYADVDSNLAWSTETDEWPAELDMEFANKLPPHQQVVFVLLRRSLLTSNPLKKIACAPALLAIVARAARKVNQDSGNRNSPLVLCTCTRLEEIQHSFISLLADPKAKHLSRESCCLGFAACRTLADVGNPGTESLTEELNSRLLKAFGQTQNFGGSAMMETAAQAQVRRRANGTLDGADTSNLNDEPMAEVGGVAGLGEAALGAYREMAEAAVSLGRPDVLYALLLLSISHAVWSTEDGRQMYSSRVLLGDQSIVGNKAGIKEMRAALRPHLQKLLPRMLRACHDPNKQTRDQMSSLFVGLTGGGAEARQTISEHLLPTIDTLISDTSSKLWRARVGACGALAQVLVGRSWSDLGGGPAAANDEIVMMLDSRIATAGAAVRILRLWRTSMRSLDDVRVTVRESGETLARGVRGLTLRLCDPTLPTEQSMGCNTQKSASLAENEAIAAATTALSWLVKYGLNQPCAEATGICVSCLVGIVDVSPAKVVEPILPQLLGSLLKAISGLEPAALNFLQVRAAGSGESSISFDRLERLRLQMAQTGPLASAVTKCLQMVPNTTIATQKSVVSEVDSALRISAGFASRAAAADAVSSLCSSCPQAFKFPGSSTGNPAVRLLRALYYASERELGQGAKEKMAHALGNLAALCPGSSVRSLAIRACDRYNAATGNNDDPMARRAAAIAVRSIAVRASYQFGDGGKHNVWCRRVLPVAFLGRTDPEPKVASLWKEVWDEGGSAASLSDTLEDFGSIPEESLLPYLVEECCKAIADVSWSRRVRGANALTELSSLGVLAPPPQSVLGIEDTERWRRRCQASILSLQSLVTCIAKTRLWSGKTAALKAAAMIAQKWGVKACEQNDARDDSLMDSAVPVLATPGKFANDLYAGDSWFIVDHDEQTIVDGDGQDHPDNMDVDKEEVKKIDFDEGDKLLEAQIDDRAEDVSDEIPTNILTLRGLCRAFFNQAFPTSSTSMMTVSNEEILPYRASSLESLAGVLTSMGDTNVSQIQKEEVYTLIAWKLLSVVTSKDNFSSGSDEAGESPLIKSRCWAVLGSCLWGGFGDNPVDKIEDLVSVVKDNCGLQQAAWSVREAAALTCSSLCLNLGVESIRNPMLIAEIVECASQTQKDKRFWRVRLAGMKILRALVELAGKSMDGESKQLILESLLPMKEQISALARKALVDSEAQVTSLSSATMTAMSWWP